MRKFVLIAFIIFITGNSASAVSMEPDAMTDLAALVTENELEVDHWEVTIREEMTYNKVQEILGQFRHKNSYLVSGEADANTIKYSVRHVQKTEGISESYSVIIPKDREYQAQFIAVVQGKFWTDDLVKQYRRLVQTIQNNFFTEDSTKFACIKTTVDDIMSSVYFFDKLKSELDLKHIKRQKDSVKNSMVKKIIYGYTPLWNQKIDLKDRPLNFQMAVNKGQNGSRELTIGTPILINEY
ncbi:YwmB family TATA-box binding protein [Virgibacillus siamensis]|uniref:YwmB family TATA-box binding protein n=1 Tax=Virgibacillus siamensis TaxID=480071 RepID=UPI0015884DBE|nr:YwmB family TATA-box binding protein [Virgibacillus siamensis]